MAITLISSPATDSNGNATNIRPAGMKKLVYKASSDNYTNTGFKYVVDVTSTDGDPEMNQRFFINPDPSGNMVIDIKPIIRKLQYQRDARTVHFITEQLQEQHMGIFRIYIQEAYNVGGVFTIDGSTEINFDDVFYFDGAYDGAIGPYPSIQPFQLNGVTKRFLSDIKHTTFRKEYVTLPAFEPVSAGIVIPVRDQDWGVMYAIASVIHDFSSIAYELWMDDQETYYSETIGALGNNQIVLPIFPANINAGAMFANTPSMYANWSYYTIQALDETDTPISAIYTFVRQQAECCNTVRIGWKGHRGGWDYFNFTKKNETEVSTERRRFISAFADTDFTAQSRELSELEADTVRTITVNSDNLTSGEFEYLQWLILSKDVRIIRDNGVSVPVVVETNTHTNYTDCYGNKMQNMTLRLRYATEYEGESEVDETEVPNNNFMEIDIQLDSAANPIFVSLPNGILVQWGDGNSSISASGVGANHTYTATGTYTIRIETGMLSFISMNDQPVVTFRNVPEEMSGMQIIGSAFLTTFDASEIPVNMSDLQLQVNALTVSTVNAVLQRLDANGLSTGLCYLQEQATTATPSGAGATAKASLISKGWTVTTD